MWCGLFGVAGNVLGVAVLGPLPSAYRPGTMVPWVAETIAAPFDASVSAVAFTLGLLSLIVWAIALGEMIDTPGTRAAGVMIACGALLNAGGTLGPFVLAQYLGPNCRGAVDCLPAGLALLGMSLALDALFNLLLGVGLIVMGAAMWRLSPGLRVRGSEYKEPGTFRSRGDSKAVALLSIIAGMATVPVCLQIWSDLAARWLAVAGPLWLLTIVATSVVLWRNRL